MNEEFYENKNVVEEDDIEDPDFKTEILPYILLNVKSELGSRSTDDFYQRMLYCCSYLQLHIELLPPEYILNNYKLLFIEVIKGIYHTSVLHTKHLRHKKMEVNFCSLFTLSLEY